ncbi:M20 family metallopeptidase [Tunturibacter empetritectus]|uniref:Glutamate carboxypeptidase n=1 Tax=Tunturiibacter empetritectus TaxID=3069691 RepID=A0A7W8IJG9_9BACT|nr:M20 family metallopeptidase [Edaphobacter lichenicola]MBB5317520.1 glutamate carboxypeptidase [Edaphobacter lichenicola]
MEAKAILSAVEKQQGWIEDTLRDLVQQESPSEDPQAVNAAAALVERWAQEIGARSKRHKQRQFGDVLELRFSPSRSRQQPVLLLGHLDTVWSLGTLKMMPWRNTAGRLWGPGVLDMKAGVIMALTAINTLKKMGLARPVTLLLNSDEEVGSTISRPITERLARESSAVLVLEPAQGLAYKTARKGVGQYNVQVTGVGAHSGVDFERGHSAVLELAKLVQTISGFTNLDRKLTVNCGVIAGGTRSNVVPSHASAEVDVRIAKASDAAYVDKLFRKLKVSDPHCKLTITGGINRPPMERKPGTIALFKKARTLAAELGFTLEEASTGGGSDGNFTAALGVPTLDGMGAVGDGAHAPHESVIIEHLVPRTALLAAMIASIE